MGSGGGGGGDAARLSAIQNAQSMSMQREVLDMQKEQAELQELERKKVMREETISAASEATNRSSYRRRGMLGEGSLVTAQGYGGYAGRDLSGGKKREYEAPEVPKPKPKASARGFTQEKAPQQRLYRSTDGDYSTQFPTEYGEGSAVTIRSTENPAYRRWKRGQHLAQNSPEYRRMMGI